MEWLNRGRWRGGEWWVGAEIMVLVVVMCCNGGGERHSAVKVGSMERRKGWDNVMPGDVILHFQSLLAQVFRGREIMETSLVDHVSPNLWNSH